MQTTAKKADNGWVLNGSKTWITNAPIADVAIVWAKTDDYDIQGFILDKNKHKFRTEKIDGKLSLRASSTGQIYMDETHVDDDCRLPGVSGLKGPFFMLE